MGHAINFFFQITHGCVTCLGLIVHILINGPCNQYVSFFEKHITECQVVATVKKTIILIIMLTPSAIYITLIVLERYIHPEWYKQWIKA